MSAQKLKRGKAAAGTARGEVTRTRIVRIARAILVRHGALALSLRRVAADAGISLSNLQFHFALQEDLLRAVLDAELAEAHSFVMRAVSRRPEAPVDAMLDALLALQHERDAARLFFSMWAVATTSKTLRKALHAFYARFIELIANVAAPDAAKRAWLFVALLEGASLFRSGIIGKTTEADDALLHDQLRALLGYGGTAS